MASDFLESVVRLTLGSSPQLLGSSFVSGGCINNTMKLETSLGSFFLKWKSNEPDLFEKERRGLELLNAQSPIVSPGVHYEGAIGENHFLLMEWIESARRSAGFWENFGTRLADQHRQTWDGFGLDHNNHIGRLPQRNESSDNWITFFIEKRIGVQLALADKSGLVSSDVLEKFSLLFRQLPDLIPPEPPSLLHGDLWSGNFMIGADGEACIFDPAVYFGHREMELAFTRMFGGFDREFYEAYQAAWPMEPGFEDRIDIHNLYPQLVHLNLFGSSYLPGILSTLKRFT